MTTPLLATEAQQSQGTDTATKPADAAQDEGAQQTTEQKTEDAKPNDTKPADTKADADTKTADQKADDKPEPKAPESYELKTPKGLPEGHELDEQVSTSFQEVARELDLSNDDAQKLLDKVMPVIHQRAQEQQAELHSKWVEAVKADKVIGGEKLQENLAVAKRFVAAYGDVELQTLLNGPLGSNPAILRAFFKAGQKVSPDRKFVDGNRGSESVDPNDPSAMARKLYPNSPSEG
jgi:hypothetical protein